MSKINQKNGFDCPGCAWPDPDEKRAFLAEYCENGAKAVAEEATKNKVSPIFFATNSVQELSELSDYEIGKSGRITHPMYLPEGKDNYEEISWENAFKMIGDELNSLDLLMRLFFTLLEEPVMKLLFCINYLCANLEQIICQTVQTCVMNLVVAALSETLGIGKGSVTLDDFNHADLVIVMGQNPGTNHPRMLTALRETKKQGGKIITINPLPEVGLMKYKDPQNPLKWIGTGQQLTDLFLTSKNKWGCSFA